MPLNIDLYNTADFCGGSVFRSRYLHKHQQKEYKMSDKSTYTLTLKQFTLLNKFFEWGVPPEEADYLDVPRLTEIMTTAELSPQGEVQLVLSASERDGITSCFEVGLGVFQDCYPENPDETDYEMVRKIAAIFKHESDHNG
jgi:hypothetical protein